DFTFDRFADHAGLVLAIRHQDDALGVHDAVDAHGDGFARDVPFAKKIRGGIEARGLVQRDQARARIARRAWFVKTDVTGSTDAQDLKIDSAGLFDLPLVVLAELEHLFAWERAV